MSDRDRKDNATSGHTQPIDPPVPENAEYRMEDNETSDSPPRDAGRTSGGGSLGHVQPDKVKREAPLRNDPESRESDEPALPSNDATLKTKI
jgi:hypothetical protein